MKISEEEVRYVARLANLELSPEEISRFSLQLSNILEHVEALKEVPTDHIDAMMQVISLEGSTLAPTPLREDVQQESMGSRLALKNAPETDSQYFKVPKVIEER